MADDVISNLTGDDLGVKTPTPANNATQGDDAAAKAAADKLAADKAASDKAAADKAAADKAAADLAAAEALKNAAKNNAPEAVEIEGVKYKLDDKGNALDDKGTVFKTKEELDAMEDEGSEEPPLVDEIIQKSGRKLLDDKGQPMKFEDSVEGIIQASKALAEQQAIERYKSLIDSDPEIKELREFKERGGTLQEFMYRKANSWSNVKLDVKNEAQLEDVIIADMVAAGMDETQAKQTAALYKDSKKLEEFGKIAYNRLVNNEKAVEEAEKKEFEQQQLQMIENNNKHWNAVKEIVTKGSLKNIVIPDADRDSFFKYIALAADDKGRSQKQLDQSKLPLEQSLQLDYLIFKGFDLSKLIENAVKTTNANNLRKRIKRPSGDSQGTNTNQYQKPNTNDITLDAIL